MASNRARRIAKEIADIHGDPHSQVTAGPLSGGDDLTHLRGSFHGPPGTPYEGGTYFVDIKIPNEYPFRPPNMRFETKVWHPNVSSQTVSGQPWIKAERAKRDSANGPSRAQYASTLSQRHGRPS
jgi:ubiquitin-conjugating enzyme (huntingtin interacting protein 2)